MNKAIFLDRDGVLNHEIYDYICRVEDFQVLEFQIPILKRFFDEGYLLIVITNQGGIALKRYSEEELAIMHQMLRNAFLKKGAEITAVYYCPHHPTVSAPCQCRKPGSKMLLDAIDMFEIDPNQSIMIGDKPRDVEAGEGAGIRGLLIQPDEQLDYYKIKEILES
ncbi:D-glycero-D-manno-heptose 1,7-bisphosphate phosphatase [Pedobacter sp. UYEF25]